MIAALGWLFLLALLVPAEFFLMTGGLRLEPYRLVLLAALLYAIWHVPLLARRATLADIGLLGLAVLVLASFWHNHGLAKAVESTGIFAVESMGAFYLARLFVATPQRLYSVQRVAVAVLAALTVLTVYEAFSHQRILHRWAEAISGQQAIDPRLYSSDYVRLGLLRAASVFEHPILYGTLLATLFPFAVWLAWQSRRLLDWLQVGGLGLSMAMTLSSAPLLALLFQAATALWVRFWHSARLLWLGLLFVGIGLLLLVEVLSNQGVLGLLIGSLTFDPNTGHFRLLQWQYTVDDIAAHWLLGIAHHDWTRPAWMEPLGNSIDSFWLLLMLQHGVLALTLLLLASLYTVAHTLQSLPSLRVQERALATTWLVAFMGLLLIGFTVDYFGKLQPLFFFMLGMVGWIGRDGIYTNHQQHIEHLLVGKPPLK